MPCGALVEIYVIGGKFSFKAKSTIITLFPERSDTLRMRLVFVLSIDIFILSHDQKVGDPMR